jgi:hypothetical protein
MVAPLLWQVSAVAGGGLHVEARQHRYRQIALLV